MVEYTFQKQVCGIAIFFPKQEAEAMLFLNLTDYALQSILFSFFIIHVGSRNRFLLELHFLKQGVLQGYKCSPL